MNDLLNLLAKDPEKSKSKIQRATAAIYSLAYNHKEQLDQLNRELAALDGAKLIQTFDCKGTQAILVEFPLFYALAFRGTEDDLQDIKSDVNAVMKPCVSGGQVHSGFNAAFECVEAQIKQALAQTEQGKSLLKDKPLLKGKPLLKDKPLLITGHSLGGALAVIAAKRLTFRYGIAGCYTFGSPRVGDEIWISAIKTPIYRVVNAADSVTMLPPNALVINGLSVIVGWIPYIGTFIRNFMVNKLHGYMHGGNMRYLTDCQSVDYHEVRLLYSVSFWFRVKAMWYGKTPFTRFIADHSIKIYRKKLAIIALKRNHKM
ncbi:lipase family protein [Vibrio sp. PP-XX7]